MGISFKSKVNIKKMQASLLEESEKKLLEAMQIAKAEIDVRTTRKNVDVSGQGFEPYSEGYAKYRKRKGRSLNVDLTFTGDMLRSIQVAVRRVGNTLEGRIFPASVSAANKIKWNQELRKFFALSREQLAKIQKKMKEIRIDKK